MEQNEFGELTLTVNAIVVLTIALKARNISRTSQEVKTKKKTKNLEIQNSKHI